MMASGGAEPSGVSSVEQQIQAVNGKLSRVESRLKEIEASWIIKIFGFWILSDQEKVLLEAEKKLLLEEKKMLLEEKQALLEEKKLRRESAGPATRGFGFDSTQSGPPLPKDLLQFLQGAKLSGSEEAYRVGVLMLKAAYGDPTEFFGYDEQTITGMQNYLTENGITPGRAAAVARAIRQEVRRARVLPDKTFEVEDQEMQLTNTFTVSRQDFEGLIRTRFPDGLLPAEGGSAVVYGWRQLLNGSKYVYPAVGKRPLVTRVKELESNGRNVVEGDETALQAHIVQKFTHCFPGIIGVPQLRVIYEPKTGAERDAAKLFLGVLSVACSSGVYEISCEIAEALNLHVSHLKGARKLFEFDAVAMSSEVAILGELKSKLTIDHVHEFRTKLSSLSQAATATHQVSMASVFKDKKLLPVIYGRAIDGNIRLEVLQEAEKHRILVLFRSGEEIGQLQPDDSFKPIMRSCDEYAQFVLPVESWRLSSLDP